MFDGDPAVVFGAVALGVFHGLEPGHGWPLAASYGLGRENPYRSGLVAGLILGIGHLVSSLAVVLAFFGLKEWFDLAGSGWLKPAAGALLIALGLWALYGTGHGHDHDHASSGSQGDERGLGSLAAAAFALGFVHEEEFQIIGLCAGSAQCLALMLVYALTVIVAIVGLTLGLIAGFEHWRERLGRVEPYLPALSGVVLILIGVGFMAGLL